MKDNKDRDEVMVAVKEDGLALEHADESLQKDKEIVMAAVKQDGRALYFAEESLQKDKEIIMEAVKQEGRALEQISSAWHTPHRHNPLSYYIA